MIKAESIFTALEDAGIFQNFDEMDTLVKQIEHLKDSDTRAAYYTGWRDSREASLIAG